MPAEAGGQATPTPDPGQRLPRPALTARLAEALERGAVVLAAGAGFGKTMALEEAFAGRPGAVAWVRCSPSHRDAGLLLEEIVGAVREAAPGAVNVLDERLAGGVEPVDVGLAIRMLRDELERLLADPLTIVFDDAEALVDAVASAAAIDGLMQARNQQLRIAVATRVPLPLGGPKLRSEQRLTELGTADLAFSVGECAELMARRTGRAPTEQEVSRAWQLTEGWPLAMALMTVASHGATSATPVGTSLFELLASEMLEPLPERLREDLIDSS